MKHYASNNWKNTRKNPEAGISCGPPAPNRNQVRVLLSGTAEEAAGFVRRHAENPDWLRLAEELEEARKPARKAVLNLIRETMTELHA